MTRSTSLGRGRLCDVRAARFRPLALALFLMFGLMQAGAIALSPEIAKADDHDAEIEEEIDDEEEDDPFSANLFEPEVILDFAEEIGLSPEAEDAMIDDVVAVQADIARLELTVRSDERRLRATLEADPVDVDKAMELAGRLIEAEQRTKLLYFGLLVRLKNALTPAQREKLAQLK